MRSARSSRTPVPRPGESRRGDPIGSLDWRKILPFRTDASSDRLDWVSMQATRCRAEPAFERSVRALSYHRLVLVTRPPDELDLRYDGVKRHNPPPPESLTISIAPLTIMKWHAHPMPNAGYILSGELTVEKKNGTKKHFIAGQALTETVDSLHRAITGDGPVVPIVFYAEHLGYQGLPFSE